MRYDEFAARYRRDSGAAWYADDPRRALTEDAAAWAHRLGRRLHDFFSGRAEPQTAPHAVRELADYSEWNRAHFVSTVRAVQSVAGGERGVRALHFHTLAHSVLPMWRPVLGAGASANVRERREAQLHLATHAAHMIVHRQEAAADPTAADDPRASASLALAHGMLSETDALVVLLEMARRRRDLLVLPAPPQFESAPGGRSADLVVADLRARTAVGIQVKTSLLTTEKARRSDPALVLVDGVTDLGNERLTPLHPRTTSKGLMPWPGLISAHFVLAANPRTPAFVRHRESIDRLRAVLPETTFGTSDYLSRAVRHLERRVLTALAP
jgi:hypothetical protein